MAIQTLVDLGSSSLDDKYALDGGRGFLNGTQTLVRLLLEQRRGDQAAGLDTGGFVSGYRGSPLGGLDKALWAARPQLERHRVHFQPGLNEDLAATSVWGTQQLHLFPGARADGVFSLWYGKGPGVDRSLDVLKHGNMAGAARHGGVLLVAGDDHGCQSSTLPHQSGPVFAAAMIPVLSPAGVHDYLRFGRFGFALSRYSGCWVGFTALAEAVESAASIPLDTYAPAFVTPDHELPPGGLNIRWPDPPMEQERRLHGPRMAAVAAFARANAIDRLEFASPADRLGIATTGKAALDVRQALDELGIDAARAAALGLRLYRIGLAWPLETAGAAGFARGLQEVLVVEEKRAFVEDQFARVLCSLPARERPNLVGKTDERGAELLPSAGELGALVVARAIVSRLAALGVADAVLMQRLARLQSLQAPVASLAVAAERKPFFCSGCPHNRSTVVPDGSQALAGIGCHGMVQQMPQRHTITSTHMGGEGANWIGMAPFNGRTHVFQNLGDGTYQHSGLLALRAASAAGIDITYKILVNGAVAMTGGQPLEGAPSIAQITHQVAAEGAKRIVVVADDPSRHHGGAGFAAGTELRHRDELDAVQRALREVPGLTVLIYDQACAAEARRGRKRTAAPLVERAVIHPGVCEGCGDCTRQSNCVSVVPLDTELGTKRAIDQGTCNGDLSCLRGFCPSFVTVRGARLRAAAGPALSTDEDPAAGLPLPAPPPLERPYGILVAGIGGTGVLTVGALLGMAAHLDGREVTVLDFTGLSQKNGAVTSDVRIAATPGALHAVRLAPGGADLLLACDLVAATLDTSLARLESGRSRVVLNTDLTPSASFVIDGIRDDPAALRARLAARCASADLHSLDATALATTLAGDATAANMLMLGVAFQRGLLPVSLEAIGRAIELNGVAVELNRRVFAWGRVAAHDASRLPTAVGRAEPPRLSFDEFVERRAQDLVAYQDRAYAQRYRTLVERVRRVEVERGGGADGLADAVARQLFALMAYKDEYEVARLYRDPAFRALLERSFEGDARSLDLEFHFAPPWLRGGAVAKRRYGAWMRHLLGLLAHGRRLRGTAFDPFGRSDDRVLERRLRDDYITLVEEIATTLTPERHSAALALARLPERVRGFGPVKRARAEEVEGERRRLLERYRSGTARAPATIPIRRLTESI